VLAAQYLDLVSSDLEDITETLLATLVVGWRDCDVLAYEPFPSDWSYNTFILAVYPIERSQFNFDVYQIRKQ